MNNLWRAVAGAALAVSCSEAALAQSGSAASVRIPAAVQSIPQTNGGLAEFLWKHLASDAARKDYSVGDHRVVDIDHDGTPEIVVTLSTTPRLVFNELLVLSGLPNGTTQVFRYTTESQQKLEGVIVDLDRDGAPEFIVPTEYAFGSGPHRVVWKVVLGWSAERGFVDESGDHIDYYESLLASATSDVVTAERALSADSDPVSKELLAGKQMILDRLLRVTRRDADAPVRRALAWSDDTDATVRRLAVRVLATFPNEAAMAKLRKLSDDPDGLVRERARSAVTAASKQSQTVDLSPADVARVERLVSADMPPGGVIVCDVKAAATQPRIAIASVDYTGRRLCDRIVRIALDGTPLVLTAIDGFRINDVSTVIRDLDFDGRAELIVPSAISLNEGQSRCRAVVPVVYSCSDSSCSDTKGQHATFLQEQLEQRLRQLATAGDPDEDARSGRLECLAMERDKLMRVTGQNPQAGSQTAEAWLGSPDPAIRRKALAVFMDLNDESARRNIQKMVDDEDPVIRDTARGVVAAR